MQAAVTLEGLDGRATMSAMRTRLALAAAALSGAAVVVSALDDAQEALAFFVAATIVALGQARLVSDASSAARRGAWFIAATWILAAAWIGVLLLMYQTASRAPPGPEATYLGLTATAYHLAALYGGMVLVTLAAWLPATSPARPTPGGSRGGGAAALRLMKLSGAVTLTGLAILLVAVVMEMATGRPGMSPVDAYWVGRLPWTPIGVGMVILGASAALLAGTVAAWLGPGWVPRSLSIPTLLAGALWWGYVSIGGYAGACCTPPAWDPVTAAYSNPVAAVLMLVVPAVVLGLAVRPPRQVVELAGSGADQYRTVSGA